MSDGRVGGNAGGGGRSAGRGAGPIRRAARRLLRVPLYYKIAGANALLLLVALAGGAWVGGQVGPGRWPGGSLLLAGAVVALGIAVNLALLRTALGPVEEIEETARRVEAGDFEARAETSAVADRDLGRLIEVFNRMLDVVGRYRRRQRALTLRTFEEEERSHEETARRLRQSAAQRVATVLVRMRAARSRLEGREGGAVSEALAALDDASELARETLEDLKRTARGLRRPEIDDLGLARALRAFAVDLAGPEGPRVELDAGSVAGCLGREKRFRLYRLLQEAVTNAVEHAEARTVTVRLSVDDGRLLAEVADDGVGFRTGPGEAGVPAGREGGTERDDAGPQGTRPDPGPGLGLLAMRERAADLGADLVLESELGRGTRVRVSLPCDGGSGAPAEGEGPGRG